jgi:hypothetical protein
LIGRATGQAVCSCVVRGIDVEDKVIEDLSSAVDSDGLPFLRRNPSLLWTRPSPIDQS